MPQLMNANACLNPISPVSGRFPGYETYGKPVLSERPRCVQAKKNPQPMAVSQTQTRERKLRTSARSRVWKRRGKPTNNQFTWGRGQRASRIQSQTSAPTTQDGYRATTQGHVTSLPWPRPLSVSWVRGSGSRERGRAFRCGARWCRM